MNRKSATHCISACAVLIMALACSADLNSPGSTASVNKKPIVVTCSSEVPTTDGKVTGRQLGSDTCTYQGIPFAAPPVAENRFKPPQAVQPYGTLHATDYKADCTQPFLEDLAPGGGDEDCLNLNVWRPAVDHGQGVENLPVMVFIYGGGFQIGGGSWFLYEGSDLTRESVVVVTINYRLGPMGYLAMPELGQEDPKGANGSYGTLDQIAALEWVNANIRNFGGNPDNVTVFGESAGAISTCQMIASPLAAGLFNRAIMESGNCVAGKLELSYPKSVSFIAATACPVSGTTSLDCLRDKSEDEIWKAVSAETAFAFWPHVDGYVIPEQPIEAIEAGRANKIDMIAGFNDDEFTLVKILPAFSNVRNMSWDQFWVLVADEFSTADASAIRAAYDETQYKTPVELWFDVLEDQIFTCSSISALNAMSRSNATYMYNFSVDKDAFDIEADAGSFHSLELSFVFGNFEFLQLLFHNEDSAERIIKHSARVQRYWTRFARTGNPNGGNDPVWSTFGDTGDVLNLDEAPEMLDDYKKAACEYWNTKLPRNNDDLFAYMARLKFYDEDKLEQEIPF